MISCLVVIELPGNITDIKHTATVNISAQCQDYIDIQLEDLKSRFNVLSYQIMS